MPALEMGQESGTIVAWLKREGEEVAAGEPLLQVETDKTVAAIEAPGAGVLCEVAAQPGETVPVGQRIAVLTAAGGSGMAPPPQPVAGRERRVKRASPAARRLARQRGVDLAALTGSGPDGAIRASDVPAASASAPVPASASAPAPDTSAAPYRVVPITGSRKVLAERLKHSYQNAPATSLTVSVDMSQVLKLIEEAASSDPPRRLTVTAVIAAFVSRVLNDHPRLNAHVTDAEIHEYGPVHLGVAVARTDDVIVPVIKDAASKSIEQIGIELSALSERARAGTIAAEEVRGSTFTITNLGATAVEEFRPLLNPPEAAILAVAVTAETPVAREGRVEILPIMRMTLVSDHRAVDGVVAAGFVGALKRVIECPALLWL